MRSTKIVATIGPASLEPGCSRPRMIAAGHGRGAAELRPRDAGASTPRPPTDPGGGGARGPRRGDPRRPPRAEAAARAGGQRRDRAGPGDARSCSPRTRSRARQSGCRWPGSGFSELVDAGDVCYLADGAVRLRVDEIPDQDVVTKVEVGGSVASRQGLNLPNVTVSLPAVSAEDISLIDAGLEMGLDFFALSFVRRREDLDPVREHLAQREAGGAADRQDREAAGGGERRGDRRGGRRDHDRPRRPRHRAADRGGAARPEAAAGAVPGRRAKPTITATQMLESMVHSTRPTRAEVADVANAIFDGTDAVMLSQETAVGRHPVLAVEMMASIAETTERELPYGRWLAERGPQANNQYHAIAFGAVGGVYQLGLKCIVSPTNTGTTATLISAYRPRAPVLALSPRQRRRAPLPAALGRAPRAQRGAAPDARADRRRAPTPRASSAWRSRATRSGSPPGLPAGTLRRHQPVQGPHDRVGRLAASAALALPEGARLLDVPARLHLAPASRAVLRVIEEGPMADVARAGLQAPPGALLDRAGDDRHQLADRAVDSARLGGEPRLARPGK